MIETYNTVTGKYDPAVSPSMVKVWTYIFICATYAYEAVMVQLLPDSATV